MRVALDKIESATKVVVRVHPQSRRMSALLALAHRAGTIPEVIEDPAVETDHCGLETSMGTTELGLDLQLKEIEQA